MPSRIARLHIPVVKQIGRRLAAAETPEQVRRVIAVASATLAPARGVRRRPVDLGGVDGLRVAPKRGAAGDRTVLLFHGGGYVFGSAKMYRGLAGRIADGATCTVEVPDYRLAPEHPYPAALDDGLAAYRAVVERVGADHLVVGGDSAGGGLTLAVLQRARSEGLPMPAGAFLLSPWLDLRGSATDLPNADSEILILPDIIDRAARWYVGAATADDPGISPILGSMDGMPPTLLQVSDEEALFAHGEAFIAAAEAAGVDVTVEIASGMWHVWQLMAPLVPEARASILSIVRFVAGCTS